MSSEQVSLSWLLQVPPERCISLYDTHIQRHVYTNITSRKTACTHAGPSRCNLHVCYKSSIRTTFSMWHEIQCLCRKVIIGQAGVSPPSHDAVVCVRLTFEGAMRAPTKGKTVAPPNSTSDNWWQKNHGDRSHTTCACICTCAQTLNQNDWR